MSRGQFDVLKIHCIEICVTSTHCTLDIIESMPPTLSISLGTVTGVNSVNAIDYCR